MIWLGFVMGFVGGLHCAAMCGPLMLGLSSRNYQWFGFLQHHLGRWIAYILLALFLRLLISPLQMMEWQQGIGIISGILILLYGLKSYIKPVQKVFEGISNYLARKMSGRIASPLMPIGLGILNGLLPCGLSFAAASLSINYVTVSDAVLFMLLFGIGTAPVLLLISYLPRWGKQEWILKTNRYLPKILMFTGFLLIIRSSGLGIPYLSPAIDPVSEEVECCD